MCLEKVEARVLYNIFLCSINYIFILIAAQVRAQFNLSWSTTFEQVPLTARPQPHPATCYKL